MNYDQFKTKVKNDGLARQNRFFIIFGAPAIKGEGAAFFNSKLRDAFLLCKSVSVPGVNVASADIFTTGETTHAPYDRNFGEASFTFYVDRNLYLRKLFEVWIDSIQSPDTRQVGWYNDFKTDITIAILPRSETGSVYFMTLYDCYPKQIGTLSLDNGNNDVMTLDITMEYRFYKTQTNDYIDQMYHSGNQDSFTYKQESNNVKSEPGKQDSFTYIAEKNRLPGTNTSSGLNTPREPSDVVRSFTKNIADNYTGITQAFQNDFFGLQNLGINGEVIVNGIGVPLNVGGALEVLQRQTMQTAKSAVTGTIARKTGIRIF
jgi:hypothetical protein